MQSPPNVDFAFFGSILKQNQFHIEREKLLLYLVKFTNLQIWSDIKRPTFKHRQIMLIRRKIYDIITSAPEKSGKTLSLSRKISQKISRKIAGRKPPSFSEQFVDPKIIRRTHPPVFGLEMFQQLRRSRVVFNNHIDISPVSASNMRLFETTGVGACLVTDWKKNLPQLFEPDKEVLTYRTAEECSEKVRYLLENEEARRSIAEAGQRRTLRDHTFENRAARIDEIIRKVLTTTT